MKSSVNRKGFAAPVGDNDSFAIPRKDCMLRNRQPCSRPGDFLNHPCPACAVYDVDDEHAPAGESGTEKVLHRMKGHIYQAIDARVSMQSVPPVNIS
jgi:hypothetical protein